MSQQGRLQDVGSLETLTGDAGGPVSGDGAGNIDILGGTNTIVTGNPGANSLTIDVNGAIHTTAPVDSGGPGVPSGGALSFLGETSTDFPNPSGLETHVGATTDEIYLENKRWFSEFIVDPSATVGLRGEYTTVQAAITAASAAGGGVVYIREGTYVEDITLEADVSLIGIQANLGNKVQIQGIVTVEYTGRVDLENIFFQTTGASLFVSTSGTPQLLMTNCFFVTTTGPICLSSNASLSIIIDFCGFISAFADIFSMSAGFLVVRYCNMGAFLAVRKRILASGTASYDFRFNLVDHSFETQDTASISIFYNSINSSTISSFNINSGGSTISSFNNNVESTAASGDFAIGTGTFAYGENVLPGTAKDISGTLTQDIADSRPRSTSAATAAGVEFGTCGFNSDQFDLTDGFVEAGGEIATSYTADTGSAVPAAGVLTVTGGTGVDTTGAGSTLTIDTAAEVATSYDADTGSAVPAAGVLTVTGGTAIDTTGAGSTLTIDAAGEIATSYTADTGSAVPAAGVLTVTGGTGIDTSGAGSTLTMDSTFGGINITEVTVVGPTAMTEDNGFIANNAGQVDLTLPVTATLGSIIKVNGKGAGGWIISQNAGQTIHFLAQDTTTGAGGSLASSTQYDCVTLRCITATTDFVVESVTGNLTVV